MEVRLKAIQKKKNSKGANFFAEWFQMVRAIRNSDILYTGKRKRDFLIIFFSLYPVNFEAFRFTCMRHVSVYFGEINFKQFPCDGIYTKKFKTTSKNWFRRFFLFSLYISSFCLPSLRVCWKAIEIKELHATFADIEKP